MSVWHSISYNLVTPDDHWEPYIFSIGPNADGSALVAAVKSDPEAEPDPIEPVDLPMSTRAQAVLTLIDDFAIATLGEWDWQRPEMYEAYALRVAHDPTHEFDQDQYAGESAQPPDDNTFSPIEEGQVATAVFTLGPEDGAELEALITKRRGAEFVAAVLDGSLYPAPGER